MQHPSTPSTASTMPSLPSPSSAPVMVRHAKHAASPYNYREVSYHLDNRGRYAIESYESRPPSRQSPPAPPSCKQCLLPTDYFFVPLSVEHARLTTFRTTSQDPTIIVQSPEYLQPDNSGSKGIAADPPKSAAPSPAPRPRRLSTPELSNLDEERPVCHCDAKKNHDFKKGCVREAYRRVSSH